MTIIEGYFDEIHFNECKIRGFEFIGRDLIIDIISYLYISRNHPLSGTLKSTDPCRLIFKNVISSVRLFDEYDESIPGRYKPEKKIIDKLNNITNLDDEIISDEYYIEGFLQSPKGWLTWDICAEKFYLDNLKNQ